MTVYELQDYAKTHPTYQVVELNDGYAIINLSRNVYLKTRYADMQRALSKAHSLAAKQSGYCKYIAPHTYAAIL